MGGVFLFVFVDLLMQSHLQRRLEYFRRSDSLLEHWSFDCALGAESVILVLIMVTIIALGRKCGIGLGWSPGT